MIKLTNTGVFFVDLFRYLCFMCYLVYSLQPFEHLLGKG